MNTMKYANMEVAFRVKLFSTILSLITALLHVCTGYVIKISRSQPPWIITITDIKFFRNGQLLPSDGFEMQMSTSEASLPACFDSSHESYCQTSVHTTRSNGVVTFFTNDSNPWIWIDTKQLFDKLVIYNYHKDHMRAWFVGTHVAIYKSRAAELKDVAMLRAEATSAELLYEFDVAWNDGSMKTSGPLEDGLTSTSAGSDLTPSIHSNSSKIAVVTGGGGFVGRHFVARLCDEKYWTVIVVDNLSAKGSLAPSRWPSHLQRCARVRQVSQFNADILYSHPYTNDLLNSASEIIFVHSDCRDFFAHQAQLGLHFHVDLFIHLAAILGGRQNIESEPFLIASNIAIDTAAFQWASQISPNHMIYFSSSVAYPVVFQQSQTNNNNNDVSAAIKLHEDMINVEEDSRSVGTPDLTYGWSKLTGEFLVNQLRTAFGVKVAVYRPFSGYGEDQDDSYPFIDILKRVLAARNRRSSSTSEDTITIELWSNATRDFVYIEDIVSCVLSTHQSLAIDHEGVAMNLASGVGTTFETLARRMAVALGVVQSGEVDSRIKFHYRAGMPKGVDYRVGSNLRTSPSSSSGRYFCPFDTSIEKGIELATQYLIKMRQPLPSGIESGSSIIESEVVDGSELVLEDRSNDALHAKLAKKLKADQDRVAPLIGASEGGFHANASTDSSVTQNQPKNKFRTSLALKYSSHHCVGSSQGMFDMKLQHTHGLFPKSTHGLFRVCHFKNVCLREGALLYYKDPLLAAVSDEYFPSNIGRSNEFEGDTELKGEALFPGYLSRYENSDIQRHRMPIKTVADAAFPPSEPRSAQKQHPYKHRYIQGAVAGVDAPSFSSNYGHYLIDNVIPHFSAARVFDLSFRDFVQVFQSECDTLGDSLLFGIGPLTDRQACINRLRTMWPWFLDHAPIFLPREPTLCFDDAVIGQGSSFSLQSLQLTRAVELREFRNHVLEKYTAHQKMTGQPDLWDIRRPNDTMNVLVYMKGVGHTSKQYREGNLCALVRSILTPTHTRGGKTAMDDLSQEDLEIEEPSAIKATEGIQRIHRRRPFAVECLSPDDTTFEEEVAAGRRAHIVVSMHGTLSYVSLFAQTKTQHIIISTLDPIYHFNEAKENQVQMYMTHIRPYYIPLETLRNLLPGTLLLAAVSVFGY